MGKLLYPRMLQRSVPVLIVALLSTLGLAQDYDAVFNNARSLLKDGRYSEAANDGRKAITLNPARWQAYYVTGAAYAGLNRCEAAIPYFQSALDHGAADALKTTIEGAIEECERQIAAKPEGSPPSTIRQPSAPTTPAKSSVSNSIQQPRGRTVTLPVEFDAYHWHKISMGAAMSQYAADDSHFEPGTLRVMRGAMTYGEGKKNKHAATFICGRFSTTGSRDSKTGEVIGFEINDGKTKIQLMTGNDSLDPNVVMATLKTACE